MAGLQDTTLAHHDTLPGRDPIDEAVRRAFDGFRLEYRLGEGGMGEVWLAEQLSPVRRQVALKVIKAGMDSKEVVARFESERQALAMMDHPAIARIFDGGATPEGRPYVVMEYVPGLPITEHSDTVRLSTTERIELLAEVCEGVQHAHQKAVIHRDLKPSNILVSTVDGKAQPKIIDFGIAKAIGIRLTDRTLYTQAGAVIGTPEYMSPEQADATGEDVDTRTDVYSLGVVLYQLLTGTLPFPSEQLRASNMDELRRKLREEEPPRPSTRVSTLGEGLAEAASARRTDPDTWRRQLETDLDAITLKAMEKDRARRYATASELAADLRRYLRREPVVARAPSRAYRTLRYVQRHRFGVVLAAGVAVLLVAFAVSMGLQARRTAMERDRANREAAVAGRVSDFLTRMFRVSDPGEARGNSITAREILDQASKDIDLGMEKDPVLQTRMMTRIAEVYTNLGLLERARALEARALEIGRLRLGADHPETLLAGDQLTIILSRMGRYPEAEALAVDTVERKRRAFGSDDDRTLSVMNTLGLLDFNQGKLDRAERVLGEVLERRQRLFGPDARPTLESANNLSEVYLRQDRLEQADRLLIDTLERKRRLLGPDHFKTFNSMANIGILRAQQQRLADSEGMFREVLAGQRRVLGPKHPDTLGNESNLGWVLSQEGLVGEGEQLLRETLKTLTETLGAEHPVTLDAQIKLGGTCVRHDRVSEGERLLRGALEAGKRAVPADNPDRAWILSELGLVALVRGQSEEALNRLEEASEHGLTPDSVSAIRSDPMWRRLAADDPRFVRWVGRTAQAELCSADVR
jgi:non-specific serine/threonine protein kinase/serine/threonine-protein kinase